MAGSCPSLAVPTRSANPSGAEVDVEEFVVNLSVGVEVVVDLELVVVGGSCCRDTAALTSVGAITVSVLVLPVPVLPKPP